LGINGLFLWLINETIAELIKIAQFRLDLMNIVRQKNNWSLFENVFNSHLIYCYRVVRDYPDKVYFHLKIFANHNTEDIYYKIRGEYNKSRPSIKQAARFIYLNKTSYNGIFRVNKAGFYNVPFGRKEKPTFHLLIHLEL